MASTACSAPYPVAGVQNLVQQRNQRGIAFQRVTLGADVAGVDRLLEYIGANQLIQNAPAIDRLRAASASMRSWIHCRLLRIGEYA